MVWGRVRDEALARGKRALEELRIEGVATTVPLHLRLLEYIDVRAGRYDVEFLERLLAA